MANYNIIREICKEKGVTLKQLAESINFSETGLQKIIKGESTKVKTLEDIARALSIPIALFFQEDPNDRIYFTEEDFKRINNMITLANLIGYKEQILSAFCFYDTKGRYISKHGVISEIFARFELKSETDKQLREKDRLISIFQNTIEDMQERKAVKPKSSK
jgi:transcriptional regulator with XRE-family HTH domain